jgi:hypothetical protein
MNGFWDWVGRVIMLSLAGMITLSIIGAIAAIPSGSLPQNVRFEQERRPSPEPEAEQRQQTPRAEREHQPQPEERTASPPVAVAVAPAPVTPIDPADWLETIAYALLALVGLFSFATLLLWRALAQWRRSADALQALADRPL